MEWILLWIGLAVITAAVANARRRRWYEWLAGGLLFSPLALILVALLPPSGVPCPTCRERIAKDAAVCPHCRTSLRSSIEASRIAGLKAKGMAENYTCIDCGKRLPLADAIREGNKLFCPNCDSLLDVMAS